MKIHTTHIIRIMLVIAAVFLVPFTYYVHAASVPSMSISPNSDGIDAQITVIGADPNASVLLNYPATTSVASVNIGTTNASGYLNATVNPSTYGISSGASVHITVDGQSSTYSIWPSFSGSGSLSLNQTSLTLSPGQTGTVTANVSASLTMSGNTNPSVASASISGNVISITAFNQGTSNITVCAGNIGCNVVSVSVQSSSSALATVSFAQSSVNLTVGQSQAVGITGSGSYYISSNSNAAVASANISGSVLNVAGVAAGSDAISVCSASGGSTTCASFNVNVTQSPNVTTSVSTTQSNLTFSQSSVNITVGQSQVVSIYGGNSGPYYVSTNQSPSSASANINTTNVDVMGIAFGGDNITVCSVTGPCGTFYVYITATGPAGTPAPSALTAPAVSSFSVSSNDGGNTFIGSGNTLTFSFTANQSISIPKMTVGGNSVMVNGSGNGPYTATYVTTGQEALPLAVGITFSNPAGSASQAYFWVGNSSKAPSSVSSASASDNSSAGHTFTEYLYNGSTGSQVTALQDRLTSDGIYSGPITGTFGDLTEAAVKAYQAKHGLDQLGVVGPATRNLLNKGI